MLSDGSECTICIKTDSKPDKVYLFKSITNAYEFGVSQVESPHIVVTLNAILNSPKKSNITYIINKGVQVILGFDIERPEPLNLQPCTSCL